MRINKTLVAGLALASAALAPSIAQAANGYATGNVNLRAGPSTGYPVVVTIAAGAPVNIYGCLSGYSWCDVGYSGTRGWVSSSYLQATYQSRRVAVPAYATRVGVPVISFSVGSYWDRNYRNRPFYRDRDRWDRPREVRQDRREIRGERRELQGERREFQGERREIRRDIRRADTRPERQDLRQELRGERRELRQERREFRQERREIRRD